jgi:hypothetical protein
MEGIKKFQWIVRLRAFFASAMLRAWVSLCPDENTRIREWVALAPDLENCAEPGEFEGWALGLANRIIRRGDSTRRAIVVDDTLSLRVESAIHDVRDLLASWLEDVEKGDLTEPPCLSNDLDYSGGVHEIVDGSVPIYTHEIATTIFLHGDWVESAFDDAGLGDRDDFKDSTLGWEGAAIHCYIMQEVSEWYEENAEEICQDWIED